MPYPLLPALTGLLLLTAAAHAVAAPIDLPDIPRCTELTPGALATDMAASTLGLRVVLDGVPQSQAASLVDVARSAYAPLAITLDVSYDNARFSSRVGSELIAEVKRFYGGSRPAGTHLVYVLTSKDLSDGSVVGDSLAGQADCIGGVAFAANAFAVGESDPAIGAKVMAHELGHLLGGHHHYANCAESLPNGGDNACTLMFNDVGFAALPISMLNSQVMRGHAQLAGSAGTQAGGASGGSADGGGSADSGGSGGSGGGSLPVLTLLCLLAAGLLQRLRARP